MKDVARAQADGGLGIGEGASELWNRAERFWSSRVSLWTFLLQSLNRLGRVRGLRTGLSSPGGAEREGPLLWWRYQAREQLEGPRKGNDRTTGKYSRDAMERGRPIQWNAAKVKLFC